MALKQLQIEYVDKEDVDFSYSNVLTDEFIDILKEMTNLTTTIYKRAERENHKLYRDAVPLVRKSLEEGGTITTSPEELSRRKSEFNRLTPHLKKDGKYHYELRNPYNNRSEYVKEGKSVQDKLIEELLEDFTGKKADGTPKYLEMGKTFYGLRAYYKAKSISESRLRHVPNENFMNLGNFFSYVKDVRKLYDDNKRDFSGLSNKFADNKVLKRIRC